ncbi:MAG: WYL domain-containing protein [Lachnospiraceae bacterium]|nr:WYL domain-containing protein [Lachnospiraceae bacterium]
MSNKKKIEKSEAEKHISRLHPVLILFILKYCSDYEHPLNPPAVTERLNILTCTRHDVKTVTRCLEDLYALNAMDGLDKVLNRKTTNEESPEQPGQPPRKLPRKVLENLEKSYALTFGGYICLSESQKNGYYFEPYITAADMHTLQGTIRSNRYISAVDKEYLHSVLDQAAPQTSITDADFIPHLPVSPDHPTAKDTSDGDLFYQKHTDFMGVVGTLYEAITDKTQVAVTSGQYTISNRHKRKVVFQKNPEPDILNPYALFWHMGDFYLLATKAGEQTPMHLRVDRLVDAKHLPIPRLPVPERLLPYFDPQTEEFLSEEYGSAYPLMTPSQEEDLILCKLECRADALSILVDTFGVEKLQIEHSPISHQDDLATLHRPDSAYFTVRIDRVQYENIREFCLRYRHLVTALQPTRLATDMFLASCDDFARYLDIFPDMLQGNWSAVDGFLKGCNTIIAAAQGHGPFTQREP